MPQIDNGPPLYCWIVTVDRPPSPDEYQVGLAILDEQSRARIRPLMAKDTPEAATSIIGRLIPHIIMASRGVHPSSWRIEGNQEGCKPRLVSRMEKQIGYSAARSEQLVAFAFALGRVDRVAQVGCDVQRVHLSKHVPIDMYLKSISHKLADSEFRSLEAADVDRERIIGRVHILWTLKEALMKALGQPFAKGFDWRRVCFDVERELVWMDGRPITGWEFRLFVARMPQSGRNKNKIYKFQVACAIHRGGTANRFTWNQRGETMDEWLRFINIDTIFERVWSLEEYPVVHEALARRQLEAQARQSSKMAVPGVNGSIPVPVSPGGMWQEQPGPGVPSYGGQTTPSPINPIYPSSSSTSLSQSQSFSQSPSQPSFSQSQSFSQPYIQTQIQPQPQIPTQTQMMPPVMPMYRKTQQEPPEQQVPHIPIPPQYVPRTGSSTNASRSTNRPGR